MRTIWRIYKVKSRMMQLCWVWEWWRSVFEIFYDSCVQTETVLITVKLVPPQLVYWHFNLVYCFFFFCSLVVIAVVLVVAFHLENGPDILKARANASLSFQTRTRAISQFLFRRITMHVQIAGSCAGPNIFKHSMICIIIFLKKNALQSANSSLEK